MKKMMDFPLLMSVVLEWELVEFTNAYAISEREIPSDWVYRFEKAEEALEELDGITLEFIVDEDWLEVTEVCQANDDAIEALINGDPEVVEHICQSVNHGFIARAVVAAIREGELKYLITA